MKIAACVVFKNEARALAEWLVYHDIIGFDTVIAYDDGSTDDSRQVCESVARIQDIRLTPWIREQGLGQMDVYRAAVRDFGQEFDWIAFIDSDEFIAPGDGVPIRRLLSTIGAADCVALNWAMFGSSGHENHQDDLVINAFTQRSHADFNPNRHVKSIVRTKSCIECVNPHHFQVAGSTVHPDGQEVVWESPGITLAIPRFDLMHINHYFTRSRADFADKIRRGAWTNQRSDADFAIYDRNEVADDSAMIYCFEIERRLRLLKHLA